MQINQKELLYASSLNALAWGPPMGLFALRLGSDHPQAKQIASACLIAGTIFFLMGGTMHYCISRVYQNQDDESEQSLLKRSLRVLSTSIVTPLIASSFIILTALGIRGVRSKCCSLIQQCTQTRYLLIFTTMTLVTQLSFTHLFANGDKPTPLSQKTLLQIAASSTISGSAIFFSACFNLI